MKNCPQCGFSIEDDALFCGSCGFRFPAPQQAPVQQAPAQQTPVQQTPIQQIPMQQPVQQTPVQQAFYQQPVQPQPPKKKKTALIAILIIIGVLIIACGTFFALEATNVINLLDSIGDPTEENTTEEAETDKDGNVISDKETETVWILTKVTNSDSRYTEILYDDEYKSVKAISYDKNGEIHDQAEHSYDSDGNILSEIYYSSLGVEYSRDEYAYDSAGNMLSDIGYHDGEEDSRHEYTYDSAGNMLSEIAYYDGEEDSRYAYTWTSVELPSEQAERVRKQMKHMMS